MSDNNVIDVQGLTKTFGQKTVVNQVNLQVKAGEIFGFLGPNGSGKTTTIRMLCGLLTPSAGMGHCLGYNILTQTDLIKLHVGYMTQRFSYYKDLTVYENLDFVAQMYGVADRKKTINELMERFDFGDRRDQLAGNMSGGWQQRLALTACLLHKPKLLLLDEPTAGVDPKARRVFWDVIQAMSQEGVTTLVSTHYMDEAERCTRLAYIAYGNLLVDGTICEVIDYVNLTTYDVRSVAGGINALFALEKKLTGLAGVDQVAIFGDHLHVCGHDAMKLAAALQPLQLDNQYQWQKINTDLEDAFLNLMDNVKDNFSGRESE